MILTVMTYSCGKEGNIPFDLKKIPSTKEITNGNTIYYSSAILTLPETWNYKIMDKSDTYIHFKDSDELIHGKFLIYNKASGVSLDSLLNKYLKNKRDVNFLWKKSFRKNNMDFKLAHGYLEYSAKDIERHKRHYQIYLGLIRHQSVIYELIILGRGKDLSIDKSFWGIINSFKINNQYKNITWKRYGLLVREIPDWKVKSTSDKEIVKMIHTKIPLSLIISHLNKINSKKDFVYQVKKDMNSRLLYLKDAQYKFEYEILSMKLLGKKSVVLHCVGSWNKNKLGLRRYYFSNNNHIYILEIGYSDKNWEKFKKEFEKLLKNISFAK